MARPIFHLLAGPNGAGKTTLYEQQLHAHLGGAEFVNADRLALEHYGHPALTLAQSQKGQDLAEARRRALMLRRMSLVTETTFSHPSKLELLHDARVLGYETRVYHINVRSAALSVARVGQRVEAGGHPVPEDKIRERYERNQALIREAVRSADRARVYDNSLLGRTHDLALEIWLGQVVRVGSDLPAWARLLYAQDLQRFVPGLAHTPAASFAVAQAIATRVLGASARTYVARPRACYRGLVIGETPLHTVQRLGERLAVAHFKAQLDRVPQVGANAVVEYPAQPGARAGVQDAPAG